MTTIDRDSFKQALIELSGAESEAVDTVMDKTEPFFIYADAGLYRFVRAEDVKKSDVARAIRTALGSPVKKVELVSVSDPWDDWPPFFGESTIKSSLHMFLEDGLMQTLPRKMVDVHYPILRQSLGPMAMSVFQLEGLIKDAMQKALWKSLKNGMEDAIWPDDLWRKLYRCINFTLTCYIGYLISGLSGSAANIEPLIDTLPLTIPLGAKKFSRSTLITFVA
ncbi:MAG: hypothetical protein U9Q03_04355 [Patescibacteria group bacterium]|nr:hypothetical protein [Patescibacteria group bacterium]